MQITPQLASHIRQMYTGGNWTWVNMKDSLADVTWQEASSQIEGFNTIAKLTFHINYYVTAILNVLRGSPINAHDKYAFDAPPINSEEDWNTLKDKSWKEAEELALLVEKLPDEKLNEIFVEEKYGNYLRNLLGILEHTHYHMGQIVIIKKFIRSQNKK